MNKDTIRGFEPSLLVDRAELASGVMRGVRGSWKYLGREFRFVDNVGGQGRRGTRHTKSRRKPRLPRNWGRPEDFGATTLSRSLLIVRPGVGEWLMRPERSSSINFGEMPPAVNLVRVGLAVGGWRLCPSRCRSRYDPRNDAASALNPLTGFKTCIHRFLCTPSLRANRRSVFLSWRRNSFEPGLRMDPLHHHPRLFSPPRPRYTSE